MPFLLRRTTLFLQAVKRENDSHYLFAEPLILNVVKVCSENTTASFRHLIYANGGCCQRQAIAPLDNNNK